MTATAVQALKPIPLATLLFRNLARGNGVDYYDGTHCSTCHLHELCLPGGLIGRDVDRMDELVYGRKRVKRGQYLYQAGDPFNSLYAVRTGFFKSNLLMEDGRDLVTGFHMMGEIMGMDGIGTGTYASNATALDDCEVCALPYTHLENLSRNMQSLQPHFHRMLSREIVRSRDVILWLGSMRAEQRLAAFMLNLSQRFTARGYSPSEFNLRMTRTEIGSYLGMKHETVSRLFTRFQDDGLVGVRQRRIRILDQAGLRKIMEQSVPSVQL
ncbi:MAG: fumarate/nitrate reduction transcriptional regulator Fnr [Georgfuchsia sp.]